MNKHIALVTGTTSGLGYSAAKQLGAAGWRQVLVTGRSPSRAQETAARLNAEAGAKTFAALTLDLDTSVSVKAAVAELIRGGRPIELLLLNAGMVAGKERVRTAQNVEASQAPLIGHHQLTMGLLEAGLLAPDARIIIAGSEAARGDVPLFNFTDVPGFAAKHHGGHLAAAVEELLRSGANVKYAPNTAYADAKLIVAWWVSALARRLPAGMAAYAVSPGSAPDTQALRNGGFVMKRLMVPMMKLIPGMAQSTEAAAQRYLQAASFGVDVSGQFFASAPKKVSGPLEAMRHAHFHHRACQEAAWEAVAKVSGVDFSSTPTPARTAPSLAGLP